jgi:membrane peptidoglycan carboxypeptidase
MNPNQAKRDSLSAMVEAGMISREQAAQLMQKSLYEQELAAIAKQTQEVVVVWDEMSGEQPQRRSLTLPSKEAARALRQELIRLTLEGKL